MPDNGYISDIRHYPALFEVSGRIPNIFKVQENCVDSVNIKFTFSIYVKKFAASLKTLILFGFSTRVEPTPNLRPRW